MFDETEYEAYFETAHGPIKVWSQVLVRADRLFLHGLTLYPATSTKMPLSVSDGLAIFHSIMEDARRQGFASCTIEAFRTSGANPGRMLVMTRTLR